MKMMEQIQQDIEYGRIISEPRMNMFGESVADVFQVTDDGEHG